MLKKQKFDGKAIAYIRDQLSDGATFGKRLLSLSLEEGSVISYIPEELNPEGLSGFEGSITLSTGLSMKGSNSRVVTFVSDFLSVHSKRYAIFETFANVGDNFRSTERLPYFTFNSEVYYFVSQENEAEKILKVLKCARHYPLICGLTFLPQSQPFVKPSQALPIEIMEKLVTRTKHILVGAYDMEGYLIWSSDQV
ncbi:MAG: hypothetical protein SXV54_10905 [Chloroflexota bacterium]|nr:hypothetical protein [Chloroflexota bacterium]